MNTPCTCEDWALKEYGLLALCPACAQEYCALLDAEAAAPALKEAAA